ncbi:MAG: hypothetical protein A2Y41_09680 [Spirochaetes bacterium GWB1_36_13]|nr:MAG: hypothetical protein A2Y41_09680 [Spirochaetes bacterium GWB1_36_13]
MDEITEDSPLVLKDLRIRGLGGLDLKPQAKFARRIIRVKPEINLYSTFLGLLTKYLIFF